jgi:hypothetical protein
MELLVGVVLLLLGAVVSVIVARNHRNNKILVELYPAFLEYAHGLEDCHTLYITNSGPDSERVKGVTLVVKPDGTHISDRSPMRFSDYKLFTDEYTLSAGETQQYIVDHRKYGKELDNITFVVRTDRRRLAVSTTNPKMRKLKKGQY